jgi:hypothetical protein
MPNANPVKPFWKSKVCLMNGIAACIAVFADWEGNPQQVVSFLAVANMILRYFTTTGITLSPR